MVSKIYEKLEKNNRLADHLEKCGFFDSQYSFKPCYSTTNLLTVVFAKIARTFNRRGATQAITLDIPNDLYKV